MIQVQKACTYQEYKKFLGKWLWECEMKHGGEWGGKYDEISGVASLEKLDD